MTIIVEDGSGGNPAANSYVSVAELDAYAIMYGVTLPPTEPEKETLLFKGMDYLAQYDGSWKGTRVSCAQPLAWPRAGVYVDGCLIASDEVPNGIKNGQMAAAVDIINNELLTTTPAGVGAIIEERVEGAVTVKYSDSGGGAVPVANSATVDVQINPYLKNAGALFGIRA